MVTGYDSTTLGDIPADAPLVLHYLNGSWPTTPAEVVTRFPQAMIESISVTPFENVGKWLDVETGDAFPWQAPDWVVMRRNAGQADAGVYVQESAWAATRSEFRLRGIPEPNWWIALWDGLPNPLEGAIGKQYAANHPGTYYYSGGHYDKSVFNYVFTGAGGVLEADMTENEHNTQSQIYYLLTTGKDSYTDQAGVFHEGTRTIWQPPSVGGTEPAEPAEPKTLTLHLPAQDIPGTLS